jgi:isoquinoline 1-oxidoreductase alpha subunit
MNHLMVNGRSVLINGPDDMPLLWALRDLAGLTGTKFGCGIGQCGACTVQIDGKPVRSCVLPISDVKGSVTTIEAIGETETGKRVQGAWLALEVVQCGRLFRRRNRRRCQLRHWAFRRQGCTREAEGCGEAA